MSQATVPISVRVPREVWRDLKNLKKEQVGQIKGVLVDAIKEAKKQLEEDFEDECD
ncbi:hypothetical protein HY500_01385 [Candidatus Woesearchaeota archaeon]|nr:hypothetical protein [Candidatus Woesearchaeota archaeon]